MRYGASQEQAESATAPASAANADDMDKVDEGKSEQRMEKKLSSCQFAHFFERAGSQ
jgi:hypothetical protein